MMLVVRDKLRCIPLGKSVCHMGVPGRNFWVTMPEDVLDKSQVLGFMVEVGAAAMAEHMTGIARVLQVASLQGLVHDGADAIPGYVAQKFSI